MHFVALRRTQIHGIYIRWQLEVRTQEQSLLFDLFKAFNQIESSHKFVFLSEKACFPSCVRNIYRVTIKCKCHAQTRMPGKLDDVSSIYICTVYPGTHVHGYHRILAIYNGKSVCIQSMFTVCPRHFGPYYIVSYYKNRLSLHVMH